MESRGLVFGYSLHSVFFVVGPGDGEHEGYEAGKLGVRQVAVAKVDDAVEGPDSGTDGPYPCCAAHRSPDTGAGVSLDADGSVWIRGARIVHFMRRLTGFVFAAVLASCGVCVGQTVAVSFPAAVAAKAARTGNGKGFDGRLLVMLSNDASTEPRMQINDTMQSQQVFGVTVDGMKPGETVSVGDGASGVADGYPRASLKEVPE